MKLKFKINYLIVICIGVLFFLLAFSANYAEGSSNKYIIGYLNTVEGTDSTKNIESTVPMENYFFKKTGIQLKSKIYNDKDSMIKDLNTGLLHFAYVSNLEYLKIKAQTDISPLVRMVKGNQDKYQALLLVRKDSNISCLKDLKGKIFSFGSKDSSHGYLYPENLVMENFKTSINNFFGSIMMTKKDSDSIFAVLYKKADVVSASATTYETLCELNPKLHRSLKVIAKSNPMVYGPIFYSNKSVKNKSDLSALAKTAIEMSNNAEGQQILMMLKLGSWTYACDEDYNSLRCMLKGSKK